MIETMPIVICGVQARTFQMGECRILVSREYGKWHLSISCRDRYPTWDEIKQSRYALLPDKITVAMLLPPKEQYINIHENTFHLYELNEGGAKND